MNHPAHDKLRRSLDALPSPLSLDQLHVQLTRMQGYEYDYFLLCQLFAKINKDIDDEITIDEFLSSLLDSEQMINTKIVQLDLLVEECKSKAVMTARKCEQAKKADQLTEKGISVDSELSVEIQSLECKGAEGSIFVKVECDGQQRHTKVRTKDSIFGEKFKTHVTTGEGDIKFEVCTLPNFVLGSLEVPFSKLRSQMETEANYAIYNEGNIVGSLKMKLQWIWNFSLYYEAMTSFWTRKQAETTQEISYLHNQVFKLMFPFTKQRLVSPSSDSSSINYTAEFRAREQEASLESIKEYSSNPSSMSSPNQTIARRISSLNSPTNQDTSNAQPFGTFEKLDFDSDEDFSRADSKGNKQFQEEAKESPIVGIDITYSGHSIDEADRNTKKFVVSESEATPSNYATIKKSGKPITAVEIVPVKTTLKSQDSFKFNQVDAAQLNPRQAPPPLQAPLILPTAATIEAFSPANLTPQRMLMLILLLGLLSTVWRTDFFTLTLAAALLYQKDLNLEISKELQAASIVTSQVMDLLWLLFCSNADYSPNASVKDASFWLSLCCFGVKLLLLKSVISI
mmetsp:Transcript_32639/g.56728  ORF Transcript_32639/g.56728 Transcript_32639/m.56728 type:complete len:569 (-) Transcript_32639:1331-3037(-)